MTSSGQHNIILDIIHEVKNKNGQTVQENKSVTVTTSTSPDDHSSFDDWCKKHQNSVKLLRDVIIGGYTITKWRKLTKK